MSNNNTTPRRSSRLANNKVDSNPYNAAARSALKKTDNNSALPYTKYNDATKNVTKATSSEAASRPAAPSDIKNAILKQYGLSTVEPPSSSSSNIQEPAAPLSQDAPNTVPPSDQVTNASVPTQDKGKNVE